MKHNLNIIVLLIGLFLMAQLIGLVIVNIYTIEEQELPYGIEKPQVEKEEVSFIPLIIFILIATGLFLLLIRFKATRLWRFWFFISVVFCLLIAFGAFLNEIIALVLAVFFGSYKIFRPNIIVHNFTELFIYGGLAAIFVPILNVFSVSILFILIIIYDMVAVWKTKHMIKMAKFQGKLKIFTGLLIPYKKGTAILGGGDIGFSLLFAGTVLKYGGFFNGFLVSLFAGLGLLFLLLIAKKKKFYPAMPFIGAGCFIGYLIGMLI
jgi:presenilin-like A22 family membrane protease